MSGERRLNREGSLFKISASKEELKIETGGLKIETGLSRIVTVLTNIVSFCHGKMC